MSRQKLAIIIAAAIFIILILIWGYFLVTNKNKPSAPTNTSTGTLNNASSSSSTTPTAPSSTSRTTNIPAPVSPSQSGSNMKTTLPDNASYSFLNNTGDASEIKTVYNTFVAKASASSAKPREWTQFFDSGKNVVPLSKTANTVGLKIPNELIEIIDDYDYELFYCTSGGKKDFGLHLTVKYVPGYPGDTMEAAEKFMKNWESTILADTHSVLFPEAQFTPEQLNQKLVFKNGKYTYADVALPNGEKGSINHGIVGNYILLASSLDCMDKTSVDLIAPSD